MSAIKKKTTNPAEKQAKDMSKKFTEEEYPDGQLIYEKILRLTINEEFG